MLAPVATEDSVKIKLVEAALAFIVAESGRETPLKPVFEILAAIRGTNEVTRLDSIIICGSLLARPISEPSVPLFAPISKTITPVGAVDA